MMVNTRRFVVSFRAAAGLLLSGLIVLSMVAFAWPVVLAEAPVRYEPTQFSMVGDPYFNPNSLSPEMRLWHDRLWLAINSDQTYPNADRAAASGDLYLMSRTLNTHITALLIAFRVTGDLALLDEVDRLMEVTRDQLRDTNGDGYLNWRWLWDPDSQFYGLDTHEMDEMLTHAMVAAAAYALKSNEQHNPIYGQHADFWTDYLENHFMAKWRERGGLDRSLTHPYANYMRMFYYLYHLTGHTNYLAEANRRADVLDSMMIAQDTGRGVAFTWEHRIPKIASEPLGCQPTIYGMLTVMAFQDMSMEGFNRYADPDYMAHYTATFRDIVAVYGTDRLSGDVCGDGEADFDKFAISSIPGLAAWDDTGDLLALSEAAYNKFEPPNNPKRIFIPAYMLRALADLPPAKASMQAFRPTTTPWAQVPPDAKALP